MERSNETLRAGPKIEKGFNQAKVCQPSRYKAHTFCGQDPRSGGLYKKEGLFEQKEGF